MVEVKYLAGIFTFSSVFASYTAFHPFKVSTTSVEFNPNPAFLENRDNWKNVSFVGPNGYQADVCGPAELVKMKFSTKWANCEKGVGQLASIAHHLDGKRTVVETHRVKTKDGYILTVYRMASPGKKRRKPVYVQHGMASASDFWFFQPKEKTLPVMLYERGYDVWISNSRGSSYSLGHETLDYNNDIKYWDFSFHDMAMYDVPAVTNHIISSTGHKKILFIGYSMGNTQILIALSEMPSMNRKIQAAFLLAPTAYMGHATSSLRYVARALHTYEAGQLISQRHNGRFNSSTQMINEFGLHSSETCAYTTARCGMCDNVWFTLFGYNSPQMNRTELPHILKRFPDIISVKAFSHYGQFINSCKFHKYSYSLKTNLEKYGSITPPEYRLENIKSHMYFYYANNDNLCTPVDVKITASRLQKSVLKELYMVPDEWFTHVDFATAKDADTLLYNKILSDMSKYK